MKNVFVLLLISFLVQLPAANSQSNEEFILMYKGKYVYQGIEHKKNDLEKILMTDTEAYPKFKAYKNTATAAKVVGFTGLAITGTGFFLILKYNSDCAEGSCAPILTGALGGFLLGAVVGGMVYNVSVHQFRKSVHIYNDNLKKKQSLGKIPAQLNIGMTVHGVGVSLNF